MDLHYCSTVVRKEESLYKSWIVESRNKIRYFCGCTGCGLG